MKLPYTPGQFAAPPRRGGAHAADELAGCPSSVARSTARSRRCARASARMRAWRTCNSPAARCRFRSRTPCARCARGTRRRRRSRSEPCLDGDVECVSAASALALGAAEGFDAVVCGIGPGIVGTGSRSVTAAWRRPRRRTRHRRCSGRPILAVRASEGDSRERHQGLSHHTRAVLGLCLGEVDRPGPRLRRSAGAGRIEVDVDGWAGRCAGLPLVHMGRGPEDDPLVFRRRLRRRPRSPRSLSR